MAEDLLYLCWDDHTYFLVRGIEIDDITPKKKKKKKKTKKKKKKN